jgi:predicted nucleic acid-binding protein
VAALVDTNVLVYRFDPRFPTKQRVATTLLADGLKGGTIRISHQAVAEFVSAVTKPQNAGAPLLTNADAWHEAEKLLVEFDILYPTDAVLRTAIRGASVYQLSWFDAHMWAYAECFGLGDLLSEDFQHGRIYGTVRTTNPFI